MARRPLRHLLPEHPLHLALAAPSSTGSPEELFGEPVANHWFGIADAGRISGLLREYRIEIVTAAMRGVPIVLALQSVEDAILAVEWLAGVRPDWTLRHSVELLDELEALGRIPSLAAIPA